MKKLLARFEGNVLSPVARGRGLKWIVATFQVSISSVKRYIAHPKYGERGKTPRSSRYQQVRIRGITGGNYAAQVERMQDATLEAHVEVGNAPQA